MKSLVILLLSITSTLTFAQAGRSCPPSLSFSANGIDNNIIESGRLLAKLTLRSSTYVQCSYRGQDHNGDYVSAVIKRNSSRGSSSNGTLYVNFESLSLNTKTKLKTISASKVSIDFSSYRGVKKVSPTTVYNTNINKVVAITRKHFIRMH